MFVRNESALDLRATQIITNQSGDIPRKYVNVIMYI